MRQQTFINIPYFQHHILGFIVGFLNISIYVESLKYTELFYCYLMSLFTYSINRNTYEKMMSYSLIFLIDKILDKENGKAGQGGLGVGGTAVSCRADPKE